MTKRVRARGRILVQGLGNRRKVRLHHRHELDSLLSSDRRSSRSRQYRQEEPRPDRVPTHHRLRVLRPRVLRQRVPPEVPQFQTARHSNFVDELCAGVVDQICVACKAAVLSLFDFGIFDCLFSTLCCTCRLLGERILFGFSTGSS